MLIIIESFSIRLFCKLQTNLLCVTSLFLVFQEGFNYHHAESGYVMLTYWIPNEPSMLPGSPSHQIGVGGFVINDKREVLIYIYIYFLFLDWGCMVDSTCWFKNMIFFPSCFN
jgi:hypothetical protein